MPSYQTRGSPETAIGSGFPNEAETVTSEPGMKNPMEEQLTPGTTGRRFPAALVTIHSPTANPSSASAVSEMKRPSGAGE